MTSAHHAQVKELFLAACGLPPEKRLEFVNAECGGNAALRDEVVELLDFHEDEAMREASASASLLEDLESIASYRVLQKVGEGGMGEVYEAEQQKPVRRRVALKVIKWGMDTKEVLARFESERQALALMNHPNIARVNEAGATSSGRPYFSMEYVKGIPITEYCDVHRLTTSERLALFCQVCEGVQHAHQRGVIHRDMKPSNVLVTVQDGRAVPKIIDFGVAKATSQRLTERTVFTELGQWIGTPEYMSPEQAEMTGLDIDTRTDVYSLGVVLYELLVGAQPFDSATLRTAGFDEMRRRIREDDPPRPSTRVSSLGGDSEVAARRRRTNPTNLVRQLKGDLDWIVMKAIEKDRTRRYPTPMELAEDIQRHLRDETVEASPPGTAYRLRKFIRRNRAVVAATAVVVAALILGFIGTGVGLVRAQREAETARQVVQLMSGLLGGMDPGAAYGHTQTIDEILDRGVARIDATLKDQPLVEAHLKDLMGRVYMGLGRFDEARPLLETALHIRREELGDSRAETADSLNHVGVLLLNSGDFRSARPLYEQALAIYSHQWGSDHWAVGVVKGNICYVLWRLGEYDEAGEYCDEALRLVEDALGPDSSRVADVLFNRGVLRRELGDSAGAVADFRRCLAIRERSFGQDHLTVGWVLHDLGIDVRLAGDTDAARALEQRALAIQEKALGPESNAVSFPLLQLAVIAAQEGDDISARPLMERVLEIRERALGPDHPDLVWALRPYGHLLRRVGEQTAARATFERALEIAKRAYGPEHLEYAVSLSALGYHEYALGNLVEARRLMEQCLAILMRCLGPNVKRTGTGYYNVACILALEGDRNQALDYLEAALDTGWAWPGVLDDPDLDSLRGDPRFETVMEEAKRRIDASKKLIAGSVQ